MLDAIMVSQTPTVETRITSLYAVLEFVYEKHSYGFDIRLSTLCSECSVEGEPLKYALSCLNNPSYSRNTGTLSATEEQKNLLRKAAVKACL